MNGSATVSLSSGRRRSPLRKEEEENIFTFIPNQIGMAYNLLMM